MDAMEVNQDECIKVKKSDLMDLMAQLSSIKKKLAEFKKQ